MNPTEKKYALMRIDEIGRSLIKKANNKYATKHITYGQALKSNMIKIKKKSEIIQILNEKVNPWWTLFFEGIDTLKKDQYKKHISEIEHLDKIKAKIQHEINLAKDKIMFEKEISTVTEILKDLLKMKI